MTNSITVDSYNLLNVSQWIDIAVQAGVNDVSSIYFSLSDERSEVIKNDLLKQAIANAESKADIATSALGLEVIGVKSISIETLGGFPPSPLQPFFAKEAAEARNPDNRFTNPNHSWSARSDIQRRYSISFWLVSFLGISPMVANAI